MPKTPASVNQTLRDVFRTIQAGLLVGDRPAAFADAARVAPTPALQSALRAHASLARRLLKPPSRATGRPLRPVPAGLVPASCSLCHLPVPHRSKDQWRKHFRVASSRKGNYARARRYDTYDKRLAVTDRARAAVRRAREDRWLAMLDPRAIKVLGRQQALVQAIRQLNRSRDAYHQIQLPQEAPR